MALIKNKVIYRSTVVEGLLRRMVVNQDEIVFYYDDSESTLTINLEDFENPVFAHQLKSLPLTVASKSIIDFNSYTILANTETLSEVIKGKKQPSQEEQEEAKRKIRAEIAQKKLAESSK